MIHHVNTHIIVCSHNKHKHNNNNNSIIISTNHIIYLRQTGPRTSNAEPDGSTPSLFTFLAFLGFFSWGVNKYIHIHTYTYVYVCVCVCV